MDLYSWSLYGNVPRGYEEILALIASQDHETSVAGEGSEEGAGTGGELLNPEEGWGGVILILNDLSRCLSRFLSCTARRCLCGIGKHVNIERRAIQGRNRGHANRGRNTNIVIAVSCAVLIITFMS